MKKLIAGLLVSVLALSGCNVFAEKEKKEYSYEESLKALQDRNDELRANYKEQMGSDYEFDSLELSGEKIQRKGKLVSATATVTNNAHRDVDSIYGVAFLDEYGSVIASKRVIIKVGANSKTYIDVHVGLSENVPKISQMILVE